MLVVDNIIRIDKNFNEINVKIADWKWTLESKWFRLYLKNIEHMECKLNDVTYEVCVV